MSENAELLFANETFYHAFHGHDMEAMDALWARHGPVVCVHPGWQALMTRAAVMESWRGILSGPGAPSIACRKPRALVQGEPGFAVCSELVGQGLIGQDDDVA